VWLGAVGTARAQPADPPAPAESGASADDAAPDAPSESEATGHTEPPEEPEVAEPDGGGLVADSSDVEEDPRAVAERRRVAHRAAIEQAEPRPPEVDVPVPDGPERARHVEIGADVAFVLRPFSDAVVASDVSYRNAVAWGLHAHFNLLEWLRVTPYFLDVHHGLDIPQGALDTDHLPDDITFSDASVKTFVFGAKIQPTLNFTDELRAWVSMGIGWGRFAFPEMIAYEGDPDREFVIRKRSSVFVEFPLGLGISYDLIDNWLAIEFESTAAPFTAQSGNANRTFQVIDGTGNIQRVGAFGAVEVSFVQGLGLSLIL
jgi:hypothetical protein